MVAKNAIPVCEKEPANLMAFARSLQNRDWFAGLLLVLGVIIAYQQVWHAGFIWDDDHHLTENPCIIGPLGFKDIWTTRAAIYYPMVLSSFWVEHFVWGLNPLSYHLVNVAMHAACAILLWRVLQNLQVRGAWLGAALWALHPVQVESVAWITELKNTQSCLFYLFAIYFFVKWRATNGIEDRNSGICKYALVLIFAMMAILSNASTVMLPVVLGLCWWWIERCWRWRNVAWLVPFVLISIAASGWTIWEQKVHSGAQGQEWAQSGLDRAVIAGKDVWFYIGKLCWPHPLIFIYSRWEISSSSLTSYLPGFAAAMGLFILWLNRNTVLRPIFLAFTYFVISLFPVLGFFNVYFFRYSFVADHFQYLASIGPLALAAAGIVTLFDFVKQRRWWLEVAICVALLGLGTLTWRQVRIYRNMETLWTDTLEKNPDSWMSDNNLGFVLFQKGQIEEAITYYKKAIQINPNSYNTEDDLGIALVRIGRVEEAMTQYRKAIEIKPDYADAHNNLGNILLQTGQAEEALIHFKKVLEIEPKFEKAYNNMGVALLRMHRLDEASNYFTKAIEIKPDYAEPHYNLGEIFGLQGNWDKAVQEYRRTLALSPNSAQACYQLGLVLEKQDKLAEAIAEYQEGARLNPREEKVKQRLRSLGVVPVQ